MKFSLTKTLFLLTLVCVAVLFSGCIADSAEDKDLPWATNQGWEGMVPIPAGAMNQYD
ncbi:MAG: hypothetical protein J6V88_02845 [Kiritimatiellae bacterium]|jgi:hypothetical protein|nr:hypothetical protein [Kiritimatiellia bacterium]